MAYEAHWDLTTPSDDTVLWRYLDFASYMDILECKTLWYPRVDSLEDPLEGGWTDSELRRIGSETSAAENFLKIPASQILQEVPDILRSVTFVSCWRAGAHESMAMWDIYRRGGAVLAIKSTIGLLKESVSQYGKPVNIGEVKYIDWQEAPWDNNLLAMSVRKELAYQHEAEVRAIVTDFSFVGIISAPKGLKVPFCPEKFITEIVVGPREKEWFHSLVQQVSKTHGLRQKVSISHLLQPSP